MEANLKPKFRRRRLNPTHRWTEKETLMLLQGVSDALNDNPGSFEKPTSQIFYEKIIAKKPVLKTITWVTLKYKIRHLKTLYQSAAVGREKVSKRLLANGDKSSVTTHINRICPNWDHLEEIFGKQLKSPAQKFQNKNDVDYLTDTSSVNVISSSNDIIEHNKSNFDELTKTNLDSIDKPASDKPTSSSRISISDPFTIPSIFDFCNVNESQQLEEREGEDSFNNTLSIQEKKLRLEIQKLEFEKEKEKNHVELRKIELQNKFEIRKLEIETESKGKLQIEKLKLESEERIKMYKIDLKFK